MPLRRTITVSITPEQDAFLQACLQSGRFGSVSEAVRAGLRLLGEREVGFIEHRTAQQTTESDAKGSLRL